MNDLVEMRKVRQKVYKSEEFQRLLAVCPHILTGIGLIQSFKSSGLFELLRRIARPGNLIETKHPDIEESFRWHNWKVSYADLIVKWVQPTRTQEQYEQVCV